METKVFNGPFNSPLNGGLYSAFGPDGQFPAWCAETSQSLMFGESIEYQLVDGTVAWGPDVSSALDRLLSTTVVNGWPVTLTQNDSVQSDIWSILSGLPGAIDTTGVVVSHHASLLHNSTKQDLLVIQSAISEPDPALLMLIGIAAIAISRIVPRIHGQAQAGSRRLLRGLCRWLQVIFARCGI